MPGCRRRGGLSLPSMLQTEEEEGPGAGRCVLTAAAERLLKVVEEEQSRAARRRAASLPWRQHARRRGGRIHAEVVDGAYTAKPRHGDRGVRVPMADQARQQGSTSPWWSRHGGGAAARLWQSRDSDAQRPGNPV